MNDKLVYHVEPEMEIETTWVCSVIGCSSICFDKNFADTMGCGAHGLSMVRVVRQFQNGHLIAEFKESA